MKIIRTIILALLYNWVIAQPLIVEPELIGLNINWKYLSRDTNFIKSPGDRKSSQFSNRIPISMFRDDNKVIVLESVIGQSPWGGIEGFLLHSLNGENGELNWINHNNISSGNSHREEYLFGDFFINSTNDYELLGLRAIDPIDKTRPYIGFYGTPIKRVIDSQTGETTEVIFNISEEKIIENYFGTGNKSVFNSYGIPLRITWGFFFEDTVLHQLINVCQIDEDMELVFPCSDSVVHNTGLRTLEPTLVYHPLTSKINDNTLIALFGIKNPEDLMLSPSKLEFFYIDISSGAKIVNKVDVTDDIHFPNGEFSEPIRIRTVGENVILYQRVVFEDSMVDPNEFIWLSWYDIDGNIKAKVDFLQIKNYYYKWFFPIGIIDEMLYLAARFDDETVSGFDIIRITQGLNEFEKCGNLYIERNDTINFTISDVLLFSDSVIIFGLKTIVLFENEYYDYHFYYSLNIAELGIILSSNENVIPIQNIPIHPNPATHSITISHGHEGEARIEVLDVMGRVLIGKTVMSAGEDELAVSVLNAGVYVVRVLDRRGVVVGRGKFIRR